MHLEVNKRAGFKIFFFSGAAKKLLIIDFHQSLEAFNVVTLNALASEATIALS